RFSLLRDKANLELTNSDASVFAIQVGVKTGTSLKFQDILLVVERPDAGERGIEMTDHGFSALLEHGNQCFPTPDGKSGMDVRTQRRLARSASLLLFCPLQFGDVSRNATNAVRLA